MPDDPIRAFFKWLRGGLFSGPELRRIFLFVSFPLHFWAIYQWFRNADIYRPRGGWELLGLFSYVAVYTLIESLFAFAVLIVLALLLPRRWPSERRQTALLGMYGVAVVWAWWSQAVVGWVQRYPAVAENVTSPINQGPVWPLVGFVLLLVATLAMPIWAAGVPRWQSVWLGLVERINLLSLLYLALDVPATVIVLLRNL